MGDEIEDPEPPDPGQPPRRRHWFVFKGETNSLPDLIEALQHTVDMLEESVRVDESFQLHRESQWGWFATDLETNQDVTPETHAEALAAWNAAGDALAAWHEAHPQPEG